jgi:hypothetical protein
MMAQCEKMDYQEHLKFCLRFDSWRLKTACSLVTGGLPEYTGESHPSPVIYEALYEASVSCAGESLLLLSSDVPIQEYRVKPSVFVHWMFQLEVARDPKFQEVWTESERKDQWDAVDDLKEFKKLFKSATGHQLPQNIVAKLRDFDEKRKSKWRCRALADYFWMLDPDLTKADIVRKGEIKIIGCKKGRFNARQVGEWIADLNPSPKPGRPKNKLA